MNVSLQNKKVNKIIPESGTNVQGVRSGYIRVFMSIKIPLWYKCAVLLTLHTPPDGMPVWVWVLLCVLSCLLVVMFTWYTSILCCHVGIFTCCHVYLLSCSIDKINPALKSTVSRVVSVCRCAHPHSLEILDFSQAKKNLIKRQDSFHKPSQVFQRVLLLEP